MAENTFPAVGEIVISQDYVGTFKVLSLSGTGMAEIQSYQTSKKQLFGRVLSNIPIGRLRPFNKHTIE